MPTLHSLCTGYLLLLFLSASSQPNPKDSAFSLDVYAEIYYQYDFGMPDNHKRPDFLYSFNRSNEVNLNIGFVRANYKGDKVRGSLALMAGTYTQTNMVNEPGVLKNIFEAYAGIKISNTKNLWVDAGIFGSHLGFESQHISTNWNLTRSLVAESSPYFETGAKITYNTDNGKWLLSALLLNGWQRIQTVEGNSLPAFGHQVTYVGKKGLKINSSAFVGTDDPDSTRRMRYFHNLFFEKPIGSKWAIIGGFDIGWQQKTKGSNHYNNWYGPVLIARFSPNTRWTLAGRLEYYDDKGEVIISTSAATGFRTSGFSLNADRWITSKLCWRMEGRLFSSPDNIYMDKEKPVNSNFALGSSLALSF